VHTIQLFLCRHAGVHLGWILQLVLVLAGASVNGALRASPAPPQATSVDATQQRIAATGRRGLVYLVSRGQQHFYLYGGAVASNDSLFPFNSLLVDILGHTQVLIVDRDPKWPVSEALTNGTLPQEQSLSLLLSPIMLALTRKALGSLGIDPGPTDRLKPWLVAETLAQEQAEKIGFHADYATVRVLLTYAQNARMQVEQLEAADTDIFVYNSMPMEVQIARLAQVLADLNTERGEQKIRLYAESWANADQAGMQRELELQQQPTYSAFTQWYWTDFHPQHIQQLADAVLRKLPVSGTALVAVPALDLVGSTGLLQALASRGCTLRTLQP
jgi:uncharacterized protein YbaP (TraB family)